MLVALFVTLIPTTIGALLSAIGIAGMDRLVRFNVLAMSGRAVEAAGDVDTLLLDKTGTITLGNRQATEFIPLPGVTEQELADAAQLASLADETPEGRSIVVLAKEKYGIRGRDMASSTRSFIPFSAQTRMSGIDFDGIVDPQGRGGRDRGLCQCRHDVPRAGGGAARRAVRWCPRRRSREITRSPTRIAKSGGTPLAVAKDGRLLGVIHLKDIVKGGISERFARAAPDGHPDGDDHRRQPADRGGDRGRGGRRRFPRPGDAGGQAEAHPRRAGARASSSPCAATAPTTRRRWRRPMSASP